MLVESARKELEELYRTYGDAQAGEQLRAEALAQVVERRWATSSMGFHAPFARELYGGGAARWLADDKAKPDEHVHHGLDAQGRIVIERSQGGRVQVYLHSPQQRIRIDGSGDRIQSVMRSHYQDGRLAAEHYCQGYRGWDTRHDYDGDRLLRSVTLSWDDEDPDWFSQYAYTYGEDGVLDRIDLQYLDGQGNHLTGADRLQYLRLPKGETLKTIEARVQSLLAPALSRALAHVPRDEPLYCLLLCYTNEDLPAAWPPFLVWGRESWRRAMVERGDSDCLWAPDEIRGSDDECERWLDDDTALRDACLLHSQLMEMKRSDASAMRVLKAMLPLLEDMVKLAGMPVTDDFVVAMADNTGEIDPLQAMKARLPAEHWALLKQRGYV